MVNVAKEEIQKNYLDGSRYWDSYLFARYSTILQLSRKLCQYAYYESLDKGFPYMISSLKTWSSSVTYLYVFIRS